MLPLSPYLKFAFYVNIIINALYIIFFPSSYTELERHTICVLIAINLLAMLLVEMIEETMKKE